MKLYLCALLALCGMYSLFTMLASSGSCPIKSRTYWPIDCAAYSKSGSAHTHIAVQGYVKYVKCESDGDTHIRIVPTQAATAPFFTAECIPSLPCGVKPAAGAHVLIKGISRHDGEHGWWEIHPIEQLKVIP